MQTDSPPTNSTHCICLECRTVLFPGERCDADVRHRVAPLDSADGVEKLVTEVWGPPSPYRTRSYLAKAGKGGATAGGGASLGDCGGCGDCGSGAGSLGEALIILAVILVVILVFYLIYRLIEYAIRHSRKPVPKGALHQGPPLLERAGVIGKIVSDNTLTAPLSGDSCAAYSIELRRKKRIFGHEVMLRDARAAMLLIELEDGRTVRVDAGRIRLAMASDSQRIFEKEVTDSYVEDLNMFATLEIETPDAIPHDEGVETVLRKGDSVVVMGELEPAPDVVDITYRHQEARTIRPSRVPMLRLA